MKTMYTEQTTITEPRELIPNILLRNASIQNRLTQEEVAEELRVTTLSVGRWERGETVPSKHARYVLCKLLNRSAEELGFPDRKKAGRGKETQPSSQLSVEPKDFDMAHEEIHKLDYHPFHEQLHHEREMRGWSQADLAEKMGCDTKTIGRWERGYGIPRPYYRQQLCQLFGKNAEVLGLTVEKEPVSARPLRKALSIATSLSAHCGDCEQPGIAIILDTIVIDPNRECTTCYFRFMVN